MVDITKLDPKLRRILSPVAGEHVDYDERGQALKELARELVHQYPNDPAMRAIGERIEALVR